MLVMSKLKYKLIKTIDFMGNEIKVIAEIIRTYRYGYDLKSGAWSLYNINKTAKPANFTVIREKGKHKLIYVNNNRIISVEDSNA